MSSQSSLTERFRSWAPVEAIATKIRAKLLFTLVGVSLLPLILLGVVMYRSASNGILDQTGKQLQSIRSIKASQLGSYFETIDKQVATFSENRMIVEAMKEFPSALGMARTEAGATEEKLMEMQSKLRAYYATQFGREYTRQTGQHAPVEAQLQSVDTDTKFLQHQYIAANPSPMGNKEAMDQADDGTTYSDLHGKYHPVVRNYLKQFGYDDIFLCDIKTGDIVYSVNKELDFATSLIDGPYSNTNFGRAFRMAAESSSKDSVFLVDFEPYLPSYENAASFIASPIFDGEEKVGVAIFQMPITRINEIMAERTGLGETGETYAIGTDRLFRSESRFTEALGIDSAVINDAVLVKTIASESVVKGNSGTGIIDGYRGEQVLSSWTPITIYKGVEEVCEPITWGLVSEIDYAEVTAPMNASGLVGSAGLIVSIGLIIGLASAIFFASGITRQAESINEMLMQIGIGNFAARAEIVTQDELGDVAIALNAMCDNTLSLIQSREERDQIEGSIIELVREMEDIADGDLTIIADVRDDMTGPIAGSINFMIGQLRSLVQRVKAATNQVNESAGQVQEVSGRLSEQSLVQAERIKGTNQQVREITASIQSVADKTRESAKVAEKARQSASDGLLAVSNTVNGMQRIRNQVQETSKRIKRLGESSQEIGEIVQLIADIADRTSILALNASIQAAMAGDAGQGFAVVAEEVERLAERSNDATKQIATLIKAIQAETSEAITDMEESTREVVEGSQLATQAGATLSEIDSVSTQLAELIADVSRATESQTGAAKQIAGTMGEISQSTTAAAQQSRVTAAQVGQLANLATALRDSVSQFRVDVGSQSNSNETAPAQFAKLSPADLNFGDATAGIKSSPASHPNEAELALADDMASAAAVVANSRVSSAGSHNENTPFPKISTKPAFLNKSSDRPTA